MPRLLAALLTSLLLLIALPARADLQVAAPAAPAAPAASGERWYGWQLLAAHGIADTLLVTGAVVSAKAPGEAGIALLAIGGLVRGGAPPLLHLLHKRSTLVAIGSGALEIGTPLLGVVLSRALGPTCKDDPSAACEHRLRVGIVAGAVAGAVVGGIVDATVLAWGGERWPRVAAGLSVAPLVVAGGGGISVGGAF